MCTAYMVHMLKTNLKQKRFHFIRFVLLRTAFCYHEGGCLTIGSENAEKKIQFICLRLKIKEKSNVVKFRMKLQSWKKSENKRLALN